MNKIFGCFLEKTSRVVMSRSLVFTEWKPETCYYWDLIENEYTNFILFINFRIHSLRFPVLEEQKCLQPSRRQYWLWLIRDKVTNLLDHTLLQNLSRYEDRQSAQIHCHQPAGRHSPLSYRWWEIPQHLKGSWHVENTDWFTSLIAAPLQ